MVKIYKRKYIEQDVYAKALDRIRHLYRIFDDVVVSFSGGKDSTALLLCTIDVARELGRLPVRAFFYDEEAIHPETIEYVDRVRKMPEVALDWYCIPVKHRNACSNESPFWHPWNPAEKDIWIRELPEGAITEHKAFQFGQSMQEFGIEHYRNTNMVVVQGIRAQESLRRQTVVSMKKQDNYISKPDRGVNFAYPIYDWSSVDVWKLVEMKDADYNHTYDIFNRTNRYEDFLKQRVCPPFGEEPLRGLNYYAECFPEIWEKMIHRVPGAATAARYGNSELYSQGYKPDSVSYQEHIENVIQTYTPSAAADLRARIDSLVSKHGKLTRDPIPDTEIHPKSGISWKFLVQIATRGDFKGRIAGKIAQNKQKAQEKETKRKEKK